MKTNESHIVKVKCPHCGWEHNVDLNAVQDEWMNNVASVGTALREAVENLHSTLETARKEAVQAWIKVPICPNCGLAYRYNAETGEVEP